MGNIKQSIDSGELMSAEPLLYLSFTQCTRKDDYIACKCEIIRGFNFPIVSVEEGEYLYVEV